MLVSAMLAFRLSNGNLHRNGLQSSKRDMANGDIRSDTQVSVHFFLGPPAVLNPSISRSLSITSYPYSLPPSQSLGLVFSFTPPFTFRRSFPLLLHSLSPFSTPPLYRPHSLFLLTSYSSSPSLFLHLRHLLFNCHHLPFLPPNVCYQRHVTPPPHPYKKEPR